MMAKPRLLLLDEPSLGLAPLVMREIFDVLRRMNESGHDDRRRRAEREPRPRRGAHAFVLETGRVVLAGESADAAGRRVRAPELPRLLMANFLQQVVSGLASGGIYGSLALAIVLIHRATGVLNFAQASSRRCRLHLLDAPRPRLVVLAGVRRDDLIRSAAAR